MDIEAGNVFPAQFSGPFSDKVIRHRFIRKVYGIVAVQLLITSGFIALTLFSDEAKFWFRQHALLGLALSIAWIPIFCCLVCSPLHRSYPANMILLMILTLCMSFSVTCSTSYYDSTTVAIAIIMTTVIVCALTLFACQTAIDFTSCWTFAFVIFIVFLLSGILISFMGGNRTAEIIHASFGVLIFSFYIIIDTQMIMGGNRNEFSPEDYVLASLSLYIDIINLFLTILRLLNRAQS